MTIIEYADYFLGKRHLGTASKKLYRATESTLDDAREAFSKSNTAMINLKLLDSAKTFYKLEPDIEHVVAPAQRDEFFFGLKMECVSPMIPAKAIFLLKKCYEQFGTINYFPAVCPKVDLNQMLSDGYIDGGYCLRDVICSLVDNQYQPLSEAELKVKHGDAYDVYITDNDSVAILPESIASLLSNRDIADIKFTNGNLVLGTKQLRFFGSHYGAIKSVYDYRTII